MSTIRYNPFKDNILSDECLYALGYSKPLRAFLLSDDPESQIVQFLVRMSIQKHLILTWYNLMTKKKTRFTELANPDIEAMLDEILEKGREIDCPKIPEKDVAKWIEYGKRQAQTLGLKVNETIENKKHTHAQAAFPHILIESLHVDQIKCFTQLDIPFHQISLIIGTNARGKSTILQLLALGLRGITTVPFSYSWQKIVHVGKPVGAFEIKLQYQNTSLSLSFQVDQHDIITCTHGQSELEQIKNDVFVVGYGVNRTIKLEEKPPYQDMGDIATLFGENAYLKHIKISENFKYVKQYFETIRQLLNPILATADVANQVVLDSFDDQSFYFITPTNPSKSIPIEALSEGFKSTFVWLFDMLLRIVTRGGNLKNAHKIHGIVLLDEIDLHLHPMWQRTILAELHKLFPNIQFIVTTHSPFVAQAAKPEEVILLDLNRHTGNIEKLDKQITSELSYRAIVRELFQIESPFSYETEQEMKKFYDIKNKLLRNEEIDHKDFRRIVHSLAKKGVEIEGVMRREIHDLERRTGKELGL